jgi:hypothetical protein
MSLRTPVDLAVSRHEGPGGTLAGGDLVMMRRRLLYLALALDSDDKGIWVYVAENETDCFYELVVEWHPSPYGVFR